MDKKGLKNKNLKKPQIPDGCVPLSELHTRLFIILFKDLPQEIEIFYSNLTKEEMESFSVRHEQRLRNISETFHSLISHNFFDVYRVNNQDSSLTAEQLNELSIKNLLLKESLTIPQEQFDDFITTNRRWCDKTPKRADGIIISEYQLGIETLPGIKEFIIEERRQVKVDNRNNLLSYIELKNKLKNQGFEDFEIRLLLKHAFEYGAYCSSIEKPIILENDDITEDGYATAYIDSVKNLVKPSPYIDAFFIKSQLNGFKPDYKFFQYNQLITKWKNCGLTEEDVVSLMARYSSYKPFSDKNNILHIMTKDGASFSKEEIEKNSNILKNAIIEKKWIEEVEERRNIQPEEMDYCKEHVALGDRIVSFIGNQLQKHSSISIDNSDNMRGLGCNNPQEFEAEIEDLELKNLIKKGIITTDGRIKIFNNISLTASGWKKFEDLKNQKNSSNNYIGLIANAVSWVKEDLPESHDEEEETSLNFATEKANDEKNNVIKKRRLYKTHRICIMALTLLKEERLCDLEESESHLWNMIIKICDPVLELRQDHLKTPEEKKLTKIRKDIKNKLALHELRMNRDSTGSDYYICFQDSQSKRPRKERKRKENDYIPFRFSTFCKEFSKFKSKILAES